MVPVLKYVRGEHLSQDHWLDMFRLLGLPKGTTLEKLTFNDILCVANTIIEKALELKVGLHTLLQKNRGCKLEQRLVEIAHISFGASCMLP